MGKILSIFLIVYFVLLCFSSVALAETSCSDSEISYYYNSWILCNTCRQYPYASFCYKKLEATSYNTGIDLSSLYQNIQTTSAMLIFYTCRTSPTTGRKGCFAVLLPQNTQTGSGIYTTIDQCLNNCY